MVPLKWRKSVPLLYAEFIMAGYLIMDLPAELTAGNTIRTNK